MWQKCPICNGTGKTGEKLGYYSIKPNCSVCQGTKIISEVSGFPPTFVPAEDFTSNVNVSKEQEIEFYKRELEDERNRINNLKLK